MIFYIVLPSLILGSAGDKSLFDVYRAARMEPSVENCQKVVAERDFIFVNAIADELQQRFDAGEDIPLLKGSSTQTLRKFKHDANKVVLTCKNVVAASDQEHMESRIGLISREMDLISTYMFLAENQGHLFETPEAVSHCRRIQSLDEFKAAVVSFMQTAFATNNVPDYLVRTFGNDSDDEAFELHAITLYRYCNDLLWQM